MWVVGLVYPYQVELKLEVSHCTTNLEEDGTENWHQEKATSNQPVPEGTEIPLPRVNSTHYNQYDTSLKHEIIFMQLRVNHLIESTWPNEYDQKICTWPKISHRRTWTMELDRKCITKTNINGWIWPKLKNIKNHYDDQPLNVTMTKIRGISVMFNRSCSSV